MELCPQGIKLRVVAVAISLKRVRRLLNLGESATGFREGCGRGVGRTGRAELTGDAFTLVAPEEEADLRGIERSIGRTLPRITVPDFDYKARPHVRLEIPMAQRIAAIRKRKADDRARAKANADRRGGAHSADKPQAPARTGPQQRPSGPKPRGPGRSSRKRRPSRHRF